MFVTRKLTPKVLIGWLGKHILWLVLLYSSITVLYHCFDLSVTIPWLPVSVIGTAVAFFVGFKNNQAYDRMWEARKIWGGIINDSRTWGMRISSFVKSENVSEDEVKKIKRRLIYRHIAWLYIHRNQLLRPAEWEQIVDKGIAGKIAKQYKQKYGLGALTSDLVINEINSFLNPEELDKLKNFRNQATHLINNQSQELKFLKDNQLIDDFEHQQLEELLRSFYTLQGQNERIKNFPFPRDYSSMSRFFVMIFVFLFPFSLIPELMKLGDWAFWISIPVSTLIGLVYIIMEDLGDYTENPFMGTPHAMPMLSLCRTIEIDLKEMLADDVIPLPIQSHNSVLM